ncbi:hypothetical protein [Vitreimonas sp.]|uniref:hypothetical protein n=1 Tax=Vitreimonas sp. TaxID=3069702 RepID=UPI002ED96B73
MSSGRTYLAPVRRPLTPAERRWLNGFIKRNEERSHDSMRTRVVVGVITASLWLATLLTSTVPAIWVTLVWAAGGATFYFWARRDFVKEASARIACAKSVLRSDAVDTFRIQSRAFAELVEFEHEIDFYAFETEDERIIFVAAQDIRHRRGFPSLDFTIAHILDEAGTVVEKRTIRNAPRAGSARILRADKLRWPIDHLEVIQARLDTLEAASPDQA